MSKQLDHTLELTFDIQCGQATHPVSLTLTAWGEVETTSPCDLLPETARRLAGNDCQKRLDKLRACFEGVVARDNAVVQLLVPIFKDTYVQEVTVETLVAIGEPSVEPLIKALKAGDSQVQEVAAEALARIGGPAVKPLIKVLEYGDWRVQSKAARLLGQIGDRRAVKPLIAIAILGDEDWDVKNIREAAAEGLVHMGAPAVEPLIWALNGGRNEVEWRKVIQILERIVARGIDPCTEISKGIDKDVRRTAAWVLGTIGKRRVLEPLIKVLRS